MHRTAWLILLLLLGARSAGWSQDLVDSEQPFLPGVWAGQAAWGDYDGDGDLDLALVGETSQAGKPERIARVLRNDQGLLFEDPDQTSRLVGVYFGDVAWADYDGDGDLDLAIAGWDANGDESLRLYRNEAGGAGGRQLTWDAAQVDPVTTISTLKGVRYARLAWGDYDGDGDPDLIVIGIDANGSSLTRIYRNERALLQVDQVNSEVVVNVHNGDVAWADYDGDGDLDLAICGQSVAPKSGVVIVTEFYRNDPEGTLTLDDNTRLTSTDGRGTILLRGGSLAWGDYDDDGLPDLAVSGRDNVWNAQLLLYRNRPAGVLSQDASFTLNTTRRIAGELAWVDYDNDGDLDLAASGRSILSDYKTLVFSNDQDRLSSSPAEDLQGLAGGGRGLGRLRRRRQGGPVGHGGGRCRPAPHPALQQQHPQRRSGPLAAVPAEPGQGNGRPGAV
jgi:hypothetical protein